MHSSGSPPPRLTIPRTVRVWIQVRLHTYLHCGMPVAVRSQHSFSVLRACAFAMGFGTLWALGWGRGDMQRRCGWYRRTLTIDFQLESTSRCSSNVGTQLKVNVLMACTLSLSLFDVASSKKNLAIIKDQCKRIIQSSGPQTNTLSCIQSADNSSRTLLYLLDEFLFARQSQTLQRATFWWGT